MKNKEKESVFLYKCLIIYSVLFVICAIGMIHILQQNNKFQQENTQLKQTVLQLQNELEDCQTTVEKLETKKKLNAEVIEFLNDEIARFHGRRNPLSYFDPN